MCHNIKKRNTRLLALVVAMLLILGQVPAVSAAETSGICGASLTWSFADGKLTISGSGDMTDYDQYTMAPWYGFREQITSLYLPEGLTSVGNLAFFDCFNLTAISIPSTVTDIGQMAFCQCSSVTILTLNNGLISIGRSAFELCGSLQDLRLPNTLTTLGYHAFYRCASLQYVTIPASVTSMDSGVFAYCEDLIRAEVLASLPALPTWTFYGCTSLTSVIMADETSSVGNEAFSGCEKLGTVYYGGEEMDAEALKEQISQNEQNFGNFGEVTNEDVGNSESSYTTEIDENGDVMVENTTVIKTDEATISTSTTTEAGGDGDGTTEITATVVSPEGWDQVMEAIESATNEADGSQLGVTIYTSGETDVPQNVLEALAGSNVVMEVQGENGSRFVVKFAEMAEMNVEQGLDLSYTLNRLETTDYEELTDVLTYRLNFSSSSTINAEVLIQLPTEHARKYATLFQVGEDGLTRLQSVVVDNRGNSHFYLASVDKETTYLIGINVPEVTAEDVIIPANLYPDYGVTDNLSNVEYVITGRTSSWGMSVGQVTWILAAVMVGSVACVGVFMFTLNKRRLKRGYVPEIYDEEE